MQEQRPKAKIITVATKLFARAGYGSTSIQSIANEVGIRKQSLLYHFPSKEVLRDAVTDDLLQRWQVRMPDLLAAATRGNEKFEAVFLEIVSFFREDSNRALYIMREVVDRPAESKQRIGVALGPWLMMLAQAIEEGRVAGRVRKDVDAQAYLVEMVVLIVGTFVAADLASAVFPDQSASVRVEQQIREILRMARTSLFTEDVLAGLKRERQS